MRRIAARTALASVVALLALTSCKGLYTEHSFEYGVGVGEGIGAEWTVDGDMFETENQRRIWFSHRMTLKRKVRSIKLVTEPPMPLRTDSRRSKSHGEDAEQPVRDDPHPQGNGPDEVNGELEHNEVHHVMHWFSDLHKDVQILIALLCAVVLTVGIYLTRGHWTKWMPWGKKHDKAPPA